MRVICATAGVELSAIAGLIPVSGQTMTHYTVREERGLGKFSVTADEAAPVYFARKDTPPFLVLYADHDMTARAEENAYFVALMKGAGHEHITGLQIAGSHAWQHCQPDHRDQRPGARGHPWICWRIEALTRRARI